MRKLFSLVAAGALVLATAAPSQAAPVPVTGSLNIIVGTLPPLGIPIPGGTTVDITGGTMTIAAGLAATTGLFVAVTGFPLNLITGIIVTASNGAGTFSAPNAAFSSPTASIAGGGFGGVMPIIGVVQVKGALAINVPISVIGKGGTVSAGGIIVQGAPWTTGVGMVTTDGPVMAMFSAAGTQMGALGALSSTVTLVTPSHVNAAGLTRLATFASLTLHFLPIPEPGTVLLLGAGLAGLVALGRRKSS